MKKTIILLAAVLISSILFAQKDTIPQKKFKHALGVAGGGTIGLGLSYQLKIDKFKSQVAFVPYGDKSNMNINLGLSFYYNIVEAEKTNLFLYQGTHYVYDKNQMYYYEEPYDAEPEYGSYTESYINTGVGFGIEFIILKRVSLSVMAGYATYNNFSRIGLTGGGSLFYNF